MQMNPDFSYEKKKIEFSSGYIFKGKHYRCSIIKYPSFYRNKIRGTENVEIYNFSPRERAVGSIIILHGLGTVNIPFLFWMGSHLASAGLQASVMILPGNYTRTATGSTSGKDFFSPDLRRLIVFWEQAVVDTMTTIDLLQQEKLWWDNNCLFGYCLGGMISTIVNAIDQRINDMILMTVGGNIAKIIWQSPVLKSIRNSLRSGSGKEGYLNDEVKLNARFEEDARAVKLIKSAHELIESDLHPLFKIDPLAYARFSDRKKVTMIEAFFDKTLPIETRKQLWEAFGRPKRYIVPVGHVSWFPFEYALGKFILKKLGIKEARRNLRLLESTKPTME
ncbi:alpha/beta hydrolase [Mesotoga prima]|uniref:alpha/beta hydrolase n=1 Tax=Mesotoga prima TaxID=1184387 RepID=UPI002D1FB4CA|nr:alpha/beta hydrolase [Mesotoga prima]